MIEGKVDLAFILDECKTEDALHVEPLMKEELKVVAASGHHILQQTSVSIKDLEKETLLLTEIGLHIGLYLKSYFAGKTYIQQIRLSLLVSRQLNNVSLRI